MSINITQSLIKSISEYVEGKECGLLLRAKYFDGVNTEPSDAMLLGQWFEYKATGQLTRHGTCPVPIRNKAPKPTKAQQEAGIKPIGKLSKKFEDVLEHIEPFKRTLDEYGFNIKSTGKRLVHDGLQGDFDIEVENKEGKVAIIDLKCSGLLENKYDDLGWHSETLEYKDKIMIQPVHYKMLGHFEYGYIPDFYFFVVSSTNTTDRKFFEVKVDGDRFNEHLNHIDKVREIIEQNEKSGWKAYPTPKGCANCPLKNSCEKFTDLPILETIYY